MDRLTKKVVSGYMINHKTETTRDYGQALCESINKLGKIEDIEEELGIDLDTLFKALKNGIYFKHHYYGIDHRRVSYIEKTSLVDRYSSWGDDEDIHFTYYDYKDYGKTWALTKEELEGEDG